MFVFVLLLMVGPPKPDPFPVVRCAELMGVPLQVC
jgi:hypothetical protein